MIFVRILEAKREFGEAIENTDLFRSAISEFKRRIC